MNIIWGMEQKTVKTTYKLQSQLHQVLITPLMYVYYKFTCSEYNRLRCMALMALTICAVVDAGLSIASSPASKSFSRYCINSVLNAWQDKASFL